MKDSYILDFLEAINYNNDMDYASGDYLTIAGLDYVVIDSRDDRVALYGFDTYYKETILLSRDDLMGEEPVTKIFRGEVYD